MKAKPNAWRQHVATTRYHKAWYQKPDFVHYPGRKRDGVVCRPGCSSVFSKTRRYICTACKKLWRNAGDGLPCCPECGGVVRFVSKDSRVPRARNRRAWKRLGKKFANPGRWDRKRE